jgi:hypothetical protein
MTRVTYEQREALCRLANRENPALAAAAERLGVPLEEAERVVLAYINNVDRTRRRVKALADERADQAFAQAIGARRFG